MSILERFHQRADDFARLLGCGRYDTHQAEQDFRGYLGSDLCSPDPDYPPWGARASWTLHVKQMRSQSGTGNPLSPLIFVASELSGDPENYQELYFKYCFDVLWKEVFGMPGCDNVRWRIRQAFKAHWGGAAKTDKEDGYAWAPFYKALRFHQSEDPGLWAAHPFVAQHMVWHSKGRGSGHQWGKASTLVKWLHQWPVFPENPTSLGSCGGQKGGLFDRSLVESESLDDFVFLSEASLDAASTQSGGGHLGETSFLEYALNKYVQPRVFLVNPQQGDDKMQEKLRKRLIPECTVVVEWVGKNSFPLSLWRHARGSWIVFAPTNMTGSNISNNGIADIARLIRKAARKL